MLAHLRPNVEMPHRALKHVQAIQYLIDVFRADVLLGFLQDRAVFYISGWEKWPVRIRLRSFSL